MCWSEIVDGGRTSSFQWNWWETADIIRNSWVIMVSSSYSSFFFFHFWEWWVCLGMQFCVWCDKREVTLRARRWLPSLCRKVGFLCNNQRKMNTLRLILLLVMSYDYQGCLLFILSWVCKFATLEVGWTVGKRTLLLFLLLKCACSLSRIAIWNCQHYGGKKATACSKCLSDLHGPTLWSMINFWWS